MVGYGAHTLTEEPPDIDERRNVMHHVEELGREHERGRLRLGPRLAGVLRNEWLLTGLDAPLMSFSRILPSGVLSTSTAVS